MDKTKLTKEQLIQLQQFIYKKGTFDRAVMLELLDHFACKVEELLAADDGLLFTAAMNKAYVSFGKKGFTPLKEAFESQLKAAYKIVYRRHLVQLLLNPVTLFCFALFGTGVYHLLIRIESFQAESWISFQVMAFFLYILIVLAGLIPKLKWPQNPKSRIYLYTTSSFGNFTLLGYGVFGMLVTAVPSWKLTLIFSVLLSIALVKLVAKYKLYQRALKDTHDFELTWNSL